MSAPPVTPPTTAFPAAPPASARAAAPAPQWAAGGASPFPAAPPAGIGRPGTPYRGGPDLASTAYGGTDGPGFATVSFPANNPLENSGSLTGHILAQGWSETPATEKSRTARVVVVLAASLGLLVAISVLVVLLAGDAMDGLVGNVLTK
ncbi:hypothetical protein [Micromonospora coxensis]|uniref:Uncharacterized protein n=1 Tax=Micromonospora coxensis TaxID=356852 RepID=A0A1C5IX10_9ACTN|nr:hypothetical protein [Micromonospora coxensis]SCG62753.1 hypothetical protein GA0070614_3544 [Micromonospora coxensis]